MSFNNPIPVTVALIVNEDGAVLTGERTIEPFIGQRALVGGYVDSMESAETGLFREIREETGHDLSQLKPEYVCSRITESNRLLLFFVVNVANTTFQTIADNNEMKNIKFSTLDEIKKQPLCFPIHQEVALHVLSNHPALKLTSDFNI